jgi:curved DNA-binding protein CbpA
VKLYDTLGVESGAGEAEIRAAYRRRARKTHPDRPGGDAEAFHAVTMARDVLLDPERRRRYDETGDEERPKDPRSEMLDELAGVFLGVVDQLPDVRHTDIVEQVRNVIRSGRESNVRSRAQVQAALEKTLEAQRRVRRKGRKKGAENHLEAMLARHAQGKRQTLEGIDRATRRCDMLLELLDEYEYGADAAPAVTFFTFASGGPG